MEIVFKQSLIQRNRWYNNKQTKQYIVMGGKRSPTKHESVAPGKFIT